MADTPMSLLARVRRQNQAADWCELVDLYEPLVRSWVARHQIPGADSADLVQDVLAVLVEKMPQFEHSGQPGAFRTWLRRIVVYQVRYFWRQRQRQTPGSGGDRTEEMLRQLEDPASDLSARWDAEHDQHVVRQLLTRLRGDFTPTTWQAFDLAVLQGRSPEAVAGELRVSVNAVYIARSRVLRRLREEAAGLLDSDASIG